MFSPSLGRWLQEDPVGFDAGDVNLYRFVENNPANLTDPMGLAPATEEIYTPEKISYTKEALLNKIGQYQVLLRNTDGIAESRKSKEYIENYKKRFMAITSPEDLRKVEEKLKNIISLSQDMLFISKQCFKDVEKVLDPDWCPPSQRTRPNGTRRNVDQMDIAEGIYNSCRKKLDALDAEVRKDIDGILDIVLKYENKKKK